MSIRISSTENRISNLIHGVTTVYESRDYLGEKTEARTTMTLQNINTYKMFNIKENSRVKRHEGLYNGETQSCYSGPRDMTL